MDHFSVNSDFSRLQTTEKQQFCNCREDHLDFLITFGCVNCSSFTAPFRILSLRYLPDMVVATSFKKQEITSLWAILIEELNPQLCVMEQLISATTALPVLSKAIENPLPSKQQATNLLSMSNDSSMVLDQVSQFLIIKLIALVNSSVSLKYGPQLHYPYNEAERKATDDLFDSSFSMISDESFIFGETACILLFSHRTLAYISFPSNSLLSVEEEAIPWLFVFDSQLHILCFTTRESSLLNTS